MEFKHVVEVVKGERSWQDRKWGTVADHPHEVGAWLTLMRNHLARAEAEWVSNSDDQRALIEIRKVISIGFACAEQHGLPERYLSIPVDRMCR